MKLTKEQQQEIKDLQSQESKTKRVTAPQLENILFEAIPVLDHGFVRVIDYMGDDTSIVQAARVSYGKGTKQVSTDSGLIKYLMRHWHSTPFEMCEIKYHIKLPIFIARQWIRHRTANVNEYSARYSILDKEFYLPNQENLAAQSKNNRQGRGDLITGDQADEVLGILILFPAVVRAGRSGVEASPRKAGGFDDGPPATFIEAIPCQHSRLLSEISLFQRRQPFPAQARLPAHLAHSARRLSDRRPLVRPAPMPGPWPAFFQVRLEAPVMTSEWVFLSCNRDFVARERKVWKAQHPATTPLAGPIDS